MKLILIYRRNSEQERPVINFKEMMRRRYPDREITEIDLDTREGADSTRLYGVVQYPAIIVTSNDGHVQGMWEGNPLPLIDEVMGAMLEEQGPTV